MNRLIRYIAVLTLALTATPAHAISLSDLFAGGTIQVGDKFFTDWEELNNESCPIAGCISGGVDTASIDVTGAGDGTAGNAYGLQFTASNGSLSATGDEFLELWFRFSVTALDPTQRITDAVMTGTVVTQGDTHLVVVEKDISNFTTSDPLALIEIFSDPLDVPSLQLSDTADLGFQTKIWVEDNVFVDGFGGSAQLTEFTQRFEQSDLPPDIEIDKATNGVDADDPNGLDIPQIAPGDPVTWTYVVTNTGIVDLTNVTVTDDQGVAVSCPQDTLTPGEIMTCTASGLAEDLSTTAFTTVPGTCGNLPNVPLYENMGQATGDYLDETVSDTDASHYCNPNPPINHAPVAVDNSYNSNEDTQLVGNVITDDTGDGVDSDEDNDGLSIISNTMVSNGVLVLNPDGSFTYNPDLNYCGPDSFTYQISDEPSLIPPSLASNTATVSLTVVCVNDPPIVTTVVTDAQSSNYSDDIAQVVITVVDVDNVSTTLAESDEPPLSAAGLTLTSMGCIEDETDSPAENGSSCSWNYNGTVLDPGDNVHVIVFTPSDTDGIGITGSHTLTIEPEDATVELDAGNGVAFKSHDDGQFHLLFSAWESVPDLAGGSPMPGDLNEMVPYMELVPVDGAGGTETGACSIKDPTNPGDGYAQVAMFDCVFDAPAKAYEVNAWVDGASDTTRYYIGSDDGQISVLYQKATSVPTLPQWSLIFLSFLLTLVAYSGVRRHR